MVLAGPQIVNLGERGMPMNGTAWVESPGWVLAEKMGVSFDATVTAKLAVARGGEPVALNNGNSVVKGAAHVGVTAADAAASGADRADEALKEGDRRTEHAAKTATESSGNAVSRSIQETRKSVKKAHRGVLELLGLKPAEGEEQN